MSLYILDHDQILFFPHVLIFLLLWYKLIKAHCCHAISILSYGFYISTLKDFFKRWIVIPSPHALWRVIMWSKSLWHLLIILKVCMAFIWQYTKGTQLNELPWLFLPKDGANLSWLHTVHCFFFLTNYDPVFVGW